MLEPWSSLALFSGFDMIDLSASKWPFHANSGYLNLRFMYPWVTGDDEDDGSLQVSKVYICQ